MDLTPLWNAASANPLAVAIISVLATALFIHFAPWLFRQLQRGGAALVAFAAGRGDDYAFERKYLNWLVNRHGYLGLLPSNVAVQLRGQKSTLELEQVFVDLAFTSSGAPTEQIDKGLGAGLRGFLWKRIDRSYALERVGGAPGRWDRMWRVIGERILDKPVESELGGLIARQPRLVIRGDPGSGKTTLMKYLAVTCARVRRNHAREGDRANLARERLGWRTRPFPIYVSLGKQGGVLTWDQDHSLVTSFADEFAGELPRAPVKFFERRLQRGNCLVLLDAFDEIGAREGRNALARHVAGLLNSAWHPTNRIVVTTRVAGYEGQLDAQGFAVQTVQPLKREQMEQLVRLRYKALALNESLNQPAERAALIQGDYERRAERLLGELNKHARLRELGVNPLLLSLIVIVHSVKVELPEERHILYRDCVEILTQNWRQAKREQLAVTPVKEELNLQQKIALLQTIALTMQLQRTRETEGQVPLLRRNVESLIANQLPNLLTTPLPDNPQARYALCAEKAHEWLEGIKVESGILEEFGFDRTTGEPLVRFSHLTFQEYLAAQALTEIPGDAVALDDNLLNSVWEEVVLLYIAMSPPARANEYAERLLERSTREDARGVLVAGRVLAEKIPLPGQTRERVMNDLHDALQSAAPADRKRACELLETLGTRESARLLVQVLECDADFQVRYAAGLALGRLGDPRFEAVAPEMVNVSAGEFLMGSDKNERESPQHTVHLAAFHIAKYPVTNVEYKRFLDETGRNIPLAIPGEFSPYDLLQRDLIQERPNHPVVYVTWHDANAYCAWLSKKTGRNFRLPTEAEWEKAARGTDGGEYPWGNEFDKEKCNTHESRIGATTPVGIYPNGASPYGALDMSGNVWEWCADWSGSDYYKDSPLENPQGPVSGQFRILCGGSFDNRADLARCALRLRIQPGSRGGYFGFRVAQSVLP